MKKEYICTMGPSIKEEDIIIKMYEKGMSTIRINMSHIDYSIEQLIHTIKKLRLMGYDIKSLIDTKGPEIRVKSNNKQVNINDQIILGKDIDLSCDYQCLETNDIIEINDGQIRLKVIEQQGTNFLCISLDSGLIKNEAGVYIEKLKRNLKFLSAEDEIDIRRAFSLNSDWLACSFVRTKEDILEVLKIKSEFPNSTTKIMAKIETKDAIINLDEIITISDGIMIARGDLSTAFPITMIGMLQNYIIQKVLDSKKYLVVGTGFLKSMKKSMRPTQAEVNDLYNTFLSGATAIMFSGETAISNSPLRVLDVANEIYESQKISKNIK